MPNYVLGRGQLFFDPFASGTENTTGERYLGNTPAFGLSVETQELDHFSSESGLQIKDESVVLRTDYTGNITCDDISLDNLALFFFGAKDTVSQSSASSETDTVTVQQGRYYQLGESAADPIGVRNVSSVTVEDSGGMGTTYTVNTDYTVDETLGRVYIVPGGNISDDTELDINYDVAAASIDRVISGSNIIQGKLRFISFNGVGNQLDFVMPKVSIRPSGEYALKGDDWQQFSFNLEILKKGTLENIYCNGRPYTP